MSDIAIRVENLGKKYKIGANQARYQTLRESIVNGFSNSIERIKGASPKEDNIIWALKDINFEVKRGEVLGIIGRNGAGKSTLLKILSRITKPTTGRFELNGRVGSLLEVGTGFHPELTGRDNIYLSGAILGMKRQEINRKFDEIVDFAEIEKFLDTPVKHYSSGMYMRLAFSVAAHLEPEILLVDEVLAVGDAEFQKKCLGKMGDVASEGRTVLFVSHNMGAIESLSTKCILIDNGEVISFSVDVNQLIKQYINASSIKNETMSNFSKIKNEFFILNDFSLLKSQDKTKSNFFTKSDSIDINIDLTILDNNPSLSIGYSLLKKEDNSSIWWSFNIDKDIIRLQKGKNILSTTIPKGILNDGNYRIELIAGIHNQKWILPPTNSSIAIDFSVKGGNLGTTSFSSTNRPTLLMPLFYWSNNHIEEN